MVYIGEVDSEDSSTAGSAFHGMLSEQWRRTTTVPLPQWPGASDSLTVWNRRYVVVSPCVGQPRFPGEQQSVPTHRPREEWTRPRCKTLQDPFLLLPWVCFRRGGIPNPQPRPAQGSLGRRTLAGTTLCSRGNRSITPDMQVRNFPTHGQLSAAQGSPTNCLSTLTSPFKWFDSSAK